MSTQKLSVVSSQLAIIYISMSKQFVRKIDGAGI